MQSAAWRLMAGALHVLAGATALALLAFGARLVRYWRGETGGLIPEGIMMAICYAVVAVVSLAAGTFLTKSLATWLVEAADRLRSWIRSRRPTAGLDDPYSPSDAQDALQQICRAARFAQPDDAHAAP